MRSPHSGKLQPSKRELLWLREGKLCYWCRKPTRYTRKKSNAWDMATLDHILPRYKGGTRDENNLVSACRLCNNRRNYEDALGLLDGSLLDSYPPKKKDRLLHRAMAHKSREALTAVVRTNHFSQPQGAFKTMKHERTDLQQIDYLLCRMEAFDKVVEVYQSIGLDERDVDMARRSEINRISMDIEELETKVYNGAQAALRVRLDTLRERLENTK